jgi:hypothetical protein
MNINFTWNRFVDSFKTIYYELKDDSKDISGISYFKVKSNIFSNPIDCILRIDGIYNVEGEILNETYTFYVGDQEKDSIGIVSAENLYRQKLNPSDISNTSTTVTFPVLTTSGIFKTFKDGFIVIVFQKDGTRIATLYE